MSALIRWPERTRPRLQTALAELSGQRYPGVARHRGRLHRRRHPSSGLVADWSDRLRSSLARQGRARRRQRRAARSHRHSPAQVAQDPPDPHRQTDIQPAPYPPTQNVCLSVLGTDPPKFSKKNHRCLSVPKVPPKSFEVPPRVECYTYSVNFKNVCKVGISVVCPY